jgi:hypothetical protein
VSRIDIYGIDTGDGARAAAIIVGGPLAENEGAQVTPLFQVQTVHLVAGRTKERIATGEMVGEGPAKARQPRAVMKATLGVQLDGAVGLQMQRLCPVVGKDL